MDHLFTHSSLHQGNCFYGVRDKSYALLQIVGETGMLGQTRKEVEGEEDSFLVRFSR